MAKPRKLTQRSVEAAVCPPGKRDVLMFDSETRGFGLRVTAAGRKSFIAQYRIVTGKRRVPIGAFGVLTVEQARQAARAVLGAAAQGGDPFIERKASADVARRAMVEAKYTFARMIEAWADARQGDRRPSYIREAVACLKRNLPSWQHRAASGITLGESVRALDELKAQKGTIAANRTLAYARAAYSWAVKRQHVLTNPLKGIEQPGRENARERLLSADELGAIWRAAGELGATLGAFARVLMLTLQRRQEVASMRWVELDDADNPTVWTIPGERAKNGKTHIVHLSEPVRTIIPALPRVNDNPFVFAGKAGKPIAAFSYAKAQIERSLSKAGRVIPDWRFHDFRRAGVTALAGMEFPPHVCDRLLNHVTGSITGVAAVYQRAEFLNERRAALDAWAEYVVAYGEGRKGADNVLRLTRTA
jgi:integrase